MRSLRNIYVIGNGPSSSHTIAPKRAAQIFSQRNSSADRFKVTLYGSLAATGKGHFTDYIIEQVLSPVATVEIVWKPEQVMPRHTNGMLFEAFKDGNAIDSWEVYSIGGGTLEDDKGVIDSPKEVYPLRTMNDILNWCEANGRAIWEYVDEYEGPEIWDYLSLIWQTMQQTVERGLNREGVLPGGLAVTRKAATYLIKSRGYVDALSNRGRLYAYALACAEENASCGEVVTAPTCGSCGVVPAVLYHLKQSRDFADVRILRALATAGIIGNIVKTNASVSGAEVGCQGEIGVACAMAASASCQLFGGTPNQIEYAAEMALEHHLGLTCDPMCGLVQIPCIERNALAAARAFDTNVYSTFSDGKHRISFDRVVAVMKQTGHDLPSLYKETSLGGLAKIDS